MDYEKTLEELKHMKIETGSFVCLGCGHEHNCSIHGCAILLDAVVCIEELKRVLQESEAARAELGRRLAAAQKMNAELTDAQAVMVKEFTEKLDELEQVKAERDAAVHDLHGECFACEHVDTDCPSMNCRNGEKFKWRGPQKEEKPHEKTDD